MPGPNCATAATHFAAASASSTTKACQYYLMLKSATFRRTLATAGARWQSPTKSCRSHIVSSLRYLDLNFGIRRSNSQPLGAAILTVGVAAGAYALLQLSSAY